ncbi:MAG: peptidyl-prolyl cis-trans isomerase SurA [Halieaceae bacterium]|jgi:peptidyl-prolyl cis-trans isomerase SurA
MIISKRWPVWLASSMLIMAVNFSHAETVLLDQVVAIVEDDIVLASQLRERLARVVAGIEARGVEGPPQEELVRETLDQLILENIQLQRGVRAGVRISDAQLNASMGRLAAQNQLSLAQFRTALEADGQSYQTTREDIRREMILQRIQQGSVNGRIQITDQEINNFLQSEEGKFLAEEEYHIVHALLPLAETATQSETEAARAYVEKLYAEISKDGDLTGAVSKTGPYTFSGGDLGWRKRGALPSLFAEIVPDLVVGQIAEPMLSASGFHLIKLVNMRGGKTVVEQTRARHILVKPSAIRNEQETQEFAEQLQQRAISGEDFADMAREYSEDIGTAAEGGDLGWINPGQMVSEFENMMNSTEIDAISTPFKSQFGWHVLSVVERRDEDVTDTVMRNMAANRLHQRKFDAELQVWLQEIRDEAFVDMK